MGRHGIYIFHVHARWQHRFVHQPLRAGIAFFFLSIVDLLCLFLRMQMILVFSSSPSPPRISPWSCVVALCCMWHVYDFEQRNTQTHGDLYSTGAQRLTLQNLFGNIKSVLLLCQQLTRHRRLPLGDLVWGRMGACLGQDETFLFFALRHVVITRIKVLYLRKYNHSWKLNTGSYRTRIEDGSWEKFHGMYLLLFVTSFAENQLSLVSCLEILPWISVLRWSIGPGLGTLVTKV